jgi:hypothetical protein
MYFPPTIPLGQLRTWLRAHADEGTNCPLCKQTVKVYRRKVNAGMARSLITMYRVGGLDWVHLPTQIGSRSREEGKLAYWGLVEEERTLRPDGGRAGYWRVTPAGELFVRGKMTIPKYARVYDGRVLSLITTEQVTIREALGDKFNYDDLMRGI